MDVRGEVAGKPGLPDAASASPARRWSVVGLLMIAYILSLADRQIMSLLVGPIRADLQVSDTEMSLLMGLSFALFYTVCGLPVARIADSGSRRLLIATGVAFWSLATAACGTAQRYWTLMLARMGVGIGEAALSPAAYSLITDLFPPGQRALAVSIYSSGIYVGSGLALAGGGLIVSWAESMGAITLPVLGIIRSWQVVFLVLGLAGAVFSLVLLVLLKEPPRGHAHRSASLAEVGATIRSKWTAVVGHNLGFGLVSVVAYATLGWTPSFFIRVHGLTAAEVGVQYGIVVALAGTLAIVLGGRVADVLVASGRRDGAMRVALAAALAGIPACSLFLWPSSSALAMVLTAPVMFCLALPMGAGPAALQELFPSNMRGQASALYIFVVNLIGLGLGPTVVALLTEHVFEDPKAVGKSLAIVAVVGLTGAALCFQWGRRQFLRHLP
ncbi:MFS transporter [Nevskia sp.]|uniref:spinster family MFS transporter n=1 Tax=Nevskia sp. TaxID=1929292 RepID=UPI0025E62847|nr:MFS transporter [Nevskia sp.]